MGSPSPPSAVWRDVEESSVSLDSSTRRPVVSSRCSWRTSSVMPSPTPSTPRGRPSPPWTSSTLSRGRDVPSTDSAVKQPTSTPDRQQQFYLKQHGFFQSQHIVYSEINSMLYTHLLIA